MRGRWLSSRLRGGPAFGSCAAAEPVLWWSSRKEAVAFYLGASGCGRRRNPAGHCTRRRSEWGPRIVTYRGESVSFLGLTPIPRFHGPEPTPVKSDWPRHFYDSAYSPPPKHIAPADERAIHSRSATAVKWQKKTNQTATRLQSSFTRREGERFTLVTRSRSFGTRSTRNPLTS